MKAKETKKYILIFIAMMTIIIIICFIPSFVKKDEEKPEGEVVLKEDTGYVDDPLELTDGPTGGDGYDAYTFSYTNADKLLEEGLYLNASYILLSSFKDYTVANKKYSGVTELTYIEGTFLENDSQQAFEIVLNNLRQSHLMVVYDKTHRTMTYTELSN